MGNVLVFGFVRLRYVRTWAGWENITYVLDITVNVLDEAYFQLIWW